MDLRKTILSGHSTAIKNRIVKHVANRQDRFNGLMKLFLEGESTLSQRAAWPLGDIGVKYPELVVKHIPSMIRKLQERNVHDAIPRQIMRVFQHLTLPEKYCATVLDLCFGFIKNEAVAPAIRANAITVAGNMCRLYPGIRQEFELILKELTRVPQPAAVMVRLRRELGLTRS